MGTARGCSIMIILSYDDITCGGPRKVFVSYYYQGDDGITKLMENFEG